MSTTANKVDKNEKMTKEEKTLEKSHIDLPYNMMNGMNNSNILSLYMDQTINNALVKEIRQLTKRFDIKSLISIIFLMGIDNLKKYVNNILSDIPKHIINLLKFVYKNMYKKSRGLILCDNEFNISNIDISNIDRHIVYIAPCFEQILIDYILLNKNSFVEFDENISKRIIMSKNKFKYNSKIDNIIIHYKNYDIYLLNSFMLQYEKIDKEIKNINIPKNYAITDELVLFNRFISILDLDFNRQYEICKKLHSFMSDNGCGDPSKDEFNTSKFLLKIFCNSDSLERVKKIVLVDNKIFGGKHNYVFSDLKISSNEKINTIILVVAFYLQFYLKFNMRINSSHSLFGYKLPNNTSINYDNFNNKFIEFFDSIFDDKNENLAIYSNILNRCDIEESHKLNYFKDVYTKSTDKTKYSKCGLQIFNNTKLLNKYDTNLVFEEFVSYLFSMNYKDEMDNDIDVYNIDILYDEIIVQEYEPEKNIEKKIDNNSIEKVHIPEKKRIIKENVYAEMTKINTIYKDFSTLYLKRDDEFKLKNMLDTFSKKRELYRNIGIPFKFNCILYGTPGTGKTSAIKAIATYLNRNIYYLDISKVKTNKELTKIFDDINKNTRDGGIIAMEDIDAMSEIVLDREHRTSFDEIKTDKDDDKLSLSHLLNILDGTLSKDNMIFIATTNYFNKLDKALTRPGRFDVVIELSECDKYQYSIIYKNILKRDLSEELINKLSNYKITPAKFIYSIIQYIGFDISDDEIISNIVSNL